jgi:hydroxymethylpyrimidine/phosphomethylpyrimidine kinase
MNRRRRTLPCALTIAGSDSGGGAGIQADLKTFAALEVYGTSALTAGTAQNTRGVMAVESVSAELVAKQIDVVLDDLPVSCAKTGMLASAPIIDAVVGALERRDLTLVVDPVMVATSGDALLEPSAEHALREGLLPRAALVTPNLPEAARLCGRPVTTLAEQREAAQALVKLGAGAALVKGGHAEGDPVDVLFDGERLLELSLPRLETTSTHGTGCTYAAAITAFLARGEALPSAVQRAHAYVHAAIASAPGLGSGHGPVHHMHPWYPALSDEDAVR